MPDAMDRRTFLGHVARTATAGAMVGNLPGLAQRLQPVYHDRHAQA